ncbi:MAG: type 4a pilus biogenesis protein PilO [Actinobacteria bacterium]|nr:type 4a pilus biogenesis protein PilO [Actinomycetota bacterium]
MKRTGVVFGFLVIVLLTALWYMFSMRPINEGIADTKAQLQTERDTEVLLRTQLAARKTIQDNELSYISAIGAMDAQIPPTPQMPALIDDLDALADETGIDWLGSTIGNPTQVENQDYFEIPISIRIEGQFFQVLGYLYGISELERLVRIDGIAATPSDKDGFTVLDVTISAKAFTTGDLVTEDVGDTTTTTTPDGGE